MTSESISTPLVGQSAFPRASPVTGGFRFALAGPEDNTELQRFARAAEMPGTLRLCFERATDYLDALRVEGRHNEVLLCREGNGNRLVATGHRSIKPAFVNGENASVGWLGGLRVAVSARSARLLEQGYACLRALHEKRPAKLYLSTIMEDNAPAREVLLSRRFGLPAYHDFGRFCCMAISLRCRFPSGSSARLTFRRAHESDGAALVDFLNREGRSKQFFPEYSVQDFGHPGGLLAHLEWEDIVLAFRGRELVGVLAAWDQRDIRQWWIAGYAPWLRALRIPLNWVARLRQMPSLPSPGSPLDYFVLSLACIRDNDRDVFRSLLGEVIRTQQGRHSFFLAGFHERDPLLPDLMARPHVPLHSRLYVVAWEDGAQAVRALDRGRIPYLETGSL